MPELGNLKPKKVVAALKRAGFFVHTTSGSHVQLKHPDRPGRVTVPYHSRFDLPKSIVKSIIRQAGLTNEEFLALLKKR